MDKPYEVFRWPTSYKGLDYEMIVFSDGNCHVVDSGAYSQAIDVLSDKNDEISRLLFRLCDEELWRDFSVEVKLDFDTYCMLREAHIATMKEVPITKADATRLEDRLTALMNALVRSPRPRLLPVPSNPR